MAPHTVRFPKPVVGLGLRCAGTVFLTGGLVWTGAPLLRTDPIIAVLVWLAAVLCAVATWNLFRLLMTPGAVMVVDAAGLSLSVPGTRTRVSFAWDEIESLHVQDTRQRALVLVLSIAAARRFDGWGPLARGRLPYNSETRTLLVARYRLGRAFDEAVDLLQKRIAGRREPEA